MRDKADNAAYMREYRRRNPEKFKLIDARANATKKAKDPVKFRADKEATRKRSRERDPELFRAKKREAWVRWKEKDLERFKVLAKRREFKRTHGIEYEVFEAALAAQGGRCDCCGTDDPRNKDGSIPMMPWHQDHNDQTGELRGVTCCHCNVMIGNAHEDIKVLQAGVAYLQRWARIGL